MSKSEKQRFLNDDSYYDKLISRKTNTNKIIDNLMKPVVKNKGLNRPHFYSVSKPGLTQFADLLFLPNDDGYRYALVVVDLYDRKTQSVPLKTKTNEEVLKGFKSIYDKKLLTIPKQIVVDSGSEFKGNVAKYFKDIGTDVKVAQPGRHQQLSLVESKNLIIGRALHKRMNEQEILTGEVSREWVEDLPKVIKAINRKTKPVISKMNRATSPVCQGDACTLFNIGDKVRVALEEPRALDESDKKLHGKFRASDIRWSVEPHTITNIFLDPGQVPLYQISGKYRVAYTKNQLQLINPNEKYPNAKKSIRGNPGTYRVDKIMDKKKIKNKFHYLIHWIGFNDPKDFTWELASKIKTDVPLIVKEYENSKK